MPQYSTKLISSCQEVFVLVSYLKQLYFTSFFCFFYDKVLREYLITLKLCLKFTPGHKSRNANEKQTISGILNKVF